MYRHFATKINNNYYGGKGDKWTQNQKDFWHHEPLKK